MRRSCLVHLGVHKTGSSSIQQTLHALSRGADWQYLPLATPNHSRTLMDAFATQPEMAHHNRLRGMGLADRPVLRQAALAALDAASAAVSLPRTILSGEGLVNLDPDGVQRFAAWLDARFSQVRLVAYIREPHSWMESTFQERLKGRDGRIGLMDLFPRYRHQLEKYELCFGSDTLDYLSFAREALHKGCVVQDFAHRYGLDVQPEAIRIANEGLGLLAVQILQACRSFAPDRPFGRQLVARLERLGGPKLRFSGQLTAPAFAHHQQDLNWMAARVDLPPQVRRDGIPAFEALLHFPAGQTNAAFRDLGWPDLADPGPVLDPARVARHVLDCAERGRA